jgi:hypothetical protein
LAKKLTKKQQQQQKKQKKHRLIASLIWPNPLDGPVSTARKLKRAALSDDAAYDVWL